MIQLINHPVGIGIGICGLGGASGRLSGLRLAAKGIDRRAIRRVRAEIVFVGNAVIVGIIGGRATHAVHALAGATVQAAVHFIGHPVGVAVDHIGTGLRDAASCPRT